MLVMTYCDYYFGYDQKDFLLYLRWYLVIPNFFLAVPEKDLVMIFVVINPTKCHNLYILHSFESVYSRMTHLNYIKLTTKLVKLCSIFFGFPKMPTQGTAT